MSGEHLTWEYLVEVELGFEELVALGKSGWELVAVDAGNSYFKRPALNFRERVTLEQRTQYYARRQQQTQAGEAS